MRFIPATVFLSEEKPRTFGGTSARGLQYQVHRARRPDRDPRHGRQEQRPAATGQGVAGMPGDFRARRAIVDTEKDAQKDRS